MVPYIISLFLYDHGFGLTLNMSTSIHVLEETL